MSLLLWGLGGAVVGFVIGAGIAWIRRGRLEQTAARAPLLVLDRTMTRDEWDAEHQGECK